MPMLRRSGGSPGTRCSPKWISPASGNSKPAMVLRVVVFPQPEGPISAISSPSRTSRYRSSTATTLPKRFVSPLTAMTDIDAENLLRRHLAVPPVDELRLLVVDPEPVPQEDLRDVGLRDGHDGPDVVGHLDLRVRGQPVELTQPHLLRFSFQHPVDEGEGGGLVLRAGGDGHVLLEHDHPLRRRHPADRRAGLLKPDRRPPVEGDTQHLATHEA